MGLCDTEHGLGGKFCWSCKYSSCKQQPPEFRVRMKCEPEILAGRREGARRGDRSTRRVATRSPQGRRGETRRGEWSTRSAPTRRVANVRSTTGVLMREGAIDSPSWSMEVSFCFFRQLCLRGKPYHEVSYIPYLLYQNEYLHWLSTWKLRPKQHGKSNQPRHYKPIGCR